MYDVIIIGAGPSGMTAAICAADKEVYQAFCHQHGRTGKESDKKILLLEKNNKIGKKLYATGNGRCNVSNAAFNMGVYYSENEYFPFQVVGACDYQTVNSFLGLLGVFVNDERGYFYPMSRQASTVVWGFTDRLRKNGIEIHTGENVKNIRKKKNGWRIKTDAGCYMTQKVVLACGGPAAPALGGTDAGIKLLEELDLPTYEFLPALCKLTCRDDLSMLSGVRARADVAIKLKARVDVDLEDVRNPCLFHEFGEVQFTENGLSGIVMFNASCAVCDLTGEIDNAFEPGSIYAILSLLPELTEEDILSRFSSFVKANPERTVLALLNGFVNEKMAAYLLVSSGITKRYIRELTEEDQRNLAHHIKHLTFELKGTAEFADAQAAFGGADTRFIEPDTMKSKVADDFYIVGELVDVCGKCGGYNLMWAILSGMKAGFDIYDTDK